MGTKVTIDAVWILISTIFASQMIMAFGKEVLGHWLLDGRDQSIRFSGSPSFIEGRCTESKAPVFNQSNSFATAPKIDLNIFSFTISCWIKQMKGSQDKMAVIYGEWRYPQGQFLLGVKNRNIVFSRGTNGSEKGWSLKSTIVSLREWTHVAVAWNHITRTVFIYVDGKEIGTRTYSPSEEFYGSTGNQSMIGNDGHKDNHQFYGSVMELYVFGRALSSDEISTLRGAPVLINKVSPVAGAAVLVRWLPPVGKGCQFLRYNVSYREVFSPVSRSNWNSVTVNKSASSHTLYLNCWKDYEIVVTSVYAKGKSDSQVWKFRTKGGDSCCVAVDWEIASSQQGWAKCPPGRYLNGVRTKPGGGNDAIDLISKGRCCTPPQEYQDEILVCQTVDRDSCPNGYFLQGFYFSSVTSLHNVEHAMCCRPSNLQNITMDCYNDAVNINKWGKTFLFSCRDWFYLTGVYKKTCGERPCITSRKCCSMSPPEMVVLGHWLLNGLDQDISFSGSPSFTEGWCPGSKAPIFDRLNSYATAPIIYLNGRSFSISCWIKQTGWSGDHAGAIYGDWFEPWQFVIRRLQRSFIFERHSSSKKEWFYVQHFNSTVPLNTWIHLVFIWNHLKGTILIYVDGKGPTSGAFSPRKEFFKPTGNLYRIGNDGHRNDHQFFGSVMDLYVFGTALSLDQINKLRGVPVIINKIKEVQGRTVLVRWEPPLDGACPVVSYNVYHREVFSQDSKSKWDSVTVSRNATSYTLHLTCRKQYEITITSVNSYRESEMSDSQIWNLRTKGDLPSSPTLNSKEIQTVGCDVNVTWSKPDDDGCPLTMFSVYYRDMMAHQSGASWREVNITDVLKTHYVLQLSCGKQYTIEMSAWNEVGKSDRSRNWIVRTSLVPSDPRRLSPSQLAGIITGVVSLLVITCIAARYWTHKKAKKRKQLALNSRPRRSKSTIIPLLQWEVLPEQVDFKEEIGRGAFGKVLRGVYREAPGIKVFTEKSRPQTVDFKEGRTVAVKVLDDVTDKEARDQLLEEIELMKAIGSHRNVVSMLGCCVSSEPIFLLLEYLPYGDLLNWLRRMRKQKSYRKCYDNNVTALAADNGRTQLGTSEDESKVIPLVANPTAARESMNRVEINSVEMDTEETSECLGAIEMQIFSTSNESKIPLDANTSHCDSKDSGTCGLSLDLKEKEDVEEIPCSSHPNVTPEIAEDGNESDEDEPNDEYFTAKDLLRFAWQISRGMGYLSSNGFIHRDLAARNILLGEGKVVKISDFGLMRHIRGEIYKIDKTKKIPVKWMAPEALLNSEYSTKSDVWSFGILLWEIATMGGNPYPGVNNKELFKLLKSGYRMEKPDSCSNEVFQLVLDCWKQKPSDRPTFDQATKILEQFLMKDTPYFDPGSLDESKIYYNEIPAEEEEAAAGTT